ncbi:unnamed protein product, partial [Ectocarpus sp. 8 AP-2014]
MQGLGRTVDEGSCIAPCGFDSGDDDAKTDFSATLAEEEGEFPVDESTTTCSTIIDTEYWHTSRDEHTDQPPVGEVEESTSSPAVELQIAEPSSRGHQPVEAVMLPRGGRNGTGLCSASFLDILPSTHELPDTTAASWLSAGILGKQTVGVGACNHEPPLETPLSRAVKGAPASDVHLLDAGAAGKTLSLSLLHEPGHETQPVCKTHSYWWSLQAPPLLEAPMLDTIATAGPTTALWVEPETEVPLHELPLCPTIRPPAIFSQARTESACARDPAGGETPPLARFGDVGQCLPSDGGVCPAVSWETMIAEPGPEDQDVTPLLSFRKDGSTVAAAAKVDLRLETCSIRPAAVTLGALCMADAKAPKVAGASSQPELEDDFVAAIKGETAGEAAFRTSPPAPPLTLESTITVDTGSPKTVLRLAPPPAQHGPKTAAPALPSCPRALPREVFTYAENQAPTCSSPPAPKVLSAVVPAHANGGPPTTIPSTPCSASSAVDRSTAIVALTDREPIGPLPSAPSEEDEEDAEQSSTDVCPVPADVPGDWWHGSAAGAHPKGAEAGKGTSASLLQRSTVDDNDRHDTCQVPASLKPLLLLEYGAASWWRQEGEICLRSPEDDGGETSEERDTVAGRYGKNVEDGGDMGGDGGRSEEAASCEALTALEVLEAAEGFLPHKATCPAELLVDKARLATPTTRALATMPTTSCLPAAIEDLFPRPAGQVCHAKEDEQATGDDGNRGDFDAKSDDDDHRAENEDDRSTGLETLVREFNAWTRTVDFPIRKVEAGLIGNGMRLGLVATEAIPQGQSYLSVPGSIVLDASKARTDPELGPPLSRLEASLGPLGLWDQDTDSLRVLLIAETFVRADLSPWAPYLRLLPTPSEMEVYHP